jgi:hypothetical protein
MLYVQFDATASGAAGREPPPGTIALLRARHLGDVLDGLELRSVEPAIMLLRCAVVLALGADAVSSRAWAERGLDGARGFALAMGARADDGRFPLGVAAFATDAGILRRTPPQPLPREGLGSESERNLSAWLRSAGVSVVPATEELVTAGAPALVARAKDAARSAWTGTLASDSPYLELLLRFGHARSLGGMWAAASRRGTRFQVEMVASLPGLSPLHVIARDPPAGADEVIPPGLESPVPLRRSAAEAPSAPITMGPPSWDEPGPCDCGTPPDLCAMKRFRLTPVPGAALSALPGADIFRQLSAAIVDLHRASASEVPGIAPGDRVVVARSPESLAALERGDTVLDAGGLCRPLGTCGDEPVGAILGVVPWPAIGEAGALRRTFSGLW